MFHYKKRGEVYHVYWYESGRHHSKAISPDLQATKEWMSRLADRLYAQKNGLLMRNHLFNDFCKEYIDKYSKITKQKRTQQKDISVVERFKKLCPEVVYTHQFTDNALNFYVLARQKANKQEATINREIGILKNMQVYAYNNKYHDKNYSPFTKLLKLPIKTQDYIVSDFEIETFMSNIYEPYLTACQLALWHGLRRGEVCHLELTDIDFSNNIIKIQKKPHLDWNPKNETSIRTVPIHPKIKNYLNKRYIQAKKSKSKFICFFEESGKELDEDVLSSMFIKLKKKINTEHKRKILSDNFSFHSLRHKFITTLINSGQPMKKISAIAGHASITMTERMYYHYTDEEELITVSNLSFGKDIENTLK